MDLSIIILDYHLKNLIKYCVKNIKDTVHDLDYEIIVVDNGTNCGTKEMLEELYPDVKFMQNGANLGFSAGNNRGIDQAKGDYVTIMNPDITVKPEAINRIVNYMKSNPDVGLVGPRLLNPNETVQLTCRRFQTLKTILNRRTPLGNTLKGRKETEDHLMKHVDHKQTMEVDWVMGACQTVRKSDLDKIGKYDERFFFYVEDMEWCRRVWMNGFKVMYLADAEMYHLHEQGSMTSPWGFFKVFKNKLTRWHVKSFLKYLHKYWNNDNYGESPTGKQLRSEG